MVVPGSMEKNGDRDQAARNAGVRSKNAQDSRAARRQKMKEEIRDLKMIISEIESNLEISKFQDITDLTIRETAPASHESQPPVHRDVNAKLQNELYRYAGLSCVSFAEERYTFRLSPSGRSERENAYAVQILSKNGKGSLGKWVLPMSIDMDQLITRIPITLLNNIPSFLKTCKHLVDCYFLRQQQFQTLMETVSTGKYCTLQTNLGYTKIALELIGVHDTQHDSYTDLVVYLLYDAAAARPHRIEVDSKGTRELDERTANSFKSFLKCFKTLELNSAFETIMRDAKKRFTWRNEQDDDSPLELNNLSNGEQDDEEFLDDTMLKRKVRMRRRDRMRSEERKKASLSKILPEIGSSSTIRSKRSGAEEPSDSCDREKIPKHKETIPVQKEETPLNKGKVNLRQTKLRFNLERADSSSSTDIISLAQEPPTQNKLFEPLTSTPLLNQNLPRSTSTSARFDFSDISVEKNSSKGENTSAKRGRGTARRARARKKSSFLR